MIDRTVMHNVVPIGIRGSAKGAVIAPVWLGTGFIVKEIAEEQTHYYLITNKHVVQGRPELVVRILKDAENTFTDISVQLFNVDGSAAFSYHPNQTVDIVAISMDKFLEPMSVLGFDLHSQSLLLKEMSARTIGEGDTIFALGYPFGMVDTQHNYPVCRMGCISLISSAYDGLNPIDYIVDAQTFPGNSGGPIIVKLNDQNGRNQYYLVGISLAYIPYQEVLFSQQTQRKRSTMEENSGLTVVHSVDRIVDVVKLESARVSLIKISKSATL